MVGRGGSYGVSELDFGSRRVVNGGIGDLNWKGFRVMASGSERNGNGGGRSRSSSSSPSTAASSFLSRSQNYALLKQQMEVAAKSEVCVLGIMCIYFLLGFSRIPNRGL